MYRIFLFFFLFSCSENSSNYFPIDKIKSWSYSVEIIPEVETKTLYKKTNISIGKKKLVLMTKNKFYFQY